MPIRTVGRFATLQYTHWFGATAPFVTTTSRNWRAIIKV